MKKEHTRFITGLLSNSKLSSAQRDKVFELAIRDFGKNGSEDRILQELKLIKNRIGITEHQKNGKEDSSGNYTQEKLDKFQGNSVINIKDKSLPDTTDIQEGITDWNTIKSEDLKELTDWDFPKMSEEAKQGIKKVLNEQEETHQSTHFSKTIFIDIKNTPQFLRSLNSNTYTKFLTHEIDSDDIEEIKVLFGGEYVFKSHIEKIKEVFDVLSNSESKYKNNYPNLSPFKISRNLYSKIKNYIYGEKFWGENKNVINWSLPELLEWSKNNPHKAPSPGKDLDYDGFIYKGTLFNNIVLAFKHEINIRSTNSFTAVFNTIIFDPKYDFRNKIIFDFDIDDSIDLFTDVEKLKQAIRLVLNLIIDKNSLDKKPKVEIKFYATHEKVYLKIKNCESYINSNINTFRYGKQTKNLMKLCNGICEIELKALFKNNKVYKGPIWKKGFVLENDQLLYYWKKFNINSQYYEEPNEDGAKSSLGVEYILTLDLGL